MGLWDSLKAALGKTQVPTDVPGLYGSEWEEAKREAAARENEARLRDIQETIWQAQQEERRKHPELYPFRLSEGTLVSSLEAGGKGGSIDAAAKIPDATEKLDTLMADAEAKHYGEKNNTNLSPRKLERFYNLVKDEAEYDLKRQPGWEEHPQFVYNGEVVDRDVPGNIGYGYLGRVFGYEDPLLTKGAGAYGIYTGLRDGKTLGEIAGDFTWDSFGDDPRDTARIRQGIARYDRLHQENNPAPTLSDLLKLGYLGD